MDSELAKLIAAFESGATGKIIKRQTTYFDLVCTTAANSLVNATYRIHFLGKRDFSIEKAKFTSLALHVEHPLLLDYTEPRKDIYLSSLVHDKQKFISNLEDAARITFGAWRPLDRYVNSQMDLNELLEKRYGLLMSVPSSFSEVVMSVAKKQNIQLNVLEGAMAQGHPLVLLMENHYVVADGFHAEMLARSPSNNSFNPSPR